MTSSRRPPGRPRDEGLDAAILAAAQELLSEGGLSALSITATAERAGTTRPAVYRRYPSAAELATAAIGSLSRTTAPEVTGEPLTDLIAELTTFRDGISSINGLGLVATMLGDGADRQARDAYRAAVVQPRRRRIAAILRGAREDGLVSCSDADLAIAVTMCTGSWYAHALAGTTPPRRWPERVARLVLAGLGGNV